MSESGHTYTTNQNILPTDFGQAEYSQEVNGYLKDLNDSMRYFVPDDLETAVDIVARLRLDASSIVGTDSGYNVEDAAIDTNEASTLLEMADKGLNIWRKTSEAIVQDEAIIATTEFKDLDSLTKQQIRLFKTQPNEPNTEAFARYKGYLEKGLRFDQLLKDSEVPKNKPVVSDELVDFGLIRRDKRGRPLKHTGKQMSADHLAVIEANKDMIVDGLATRNMPGPVASIPSELLDLGLVRQDKLGRPMNYKGKQITRENLAVIAANKVLIANGLGTRDVPGVTRPALPVQVNLPVPLSRRLNQQQLRSADERAYEKDRAAYLRVLEDSRSELRYTDWKSRRSGKVSDDEFTKRVNDFMRDYDKAHTHFDQKTGEYVEQKRGLRGLLIRSQEADGETRTQRLRRLSRDVLGEAAVGAVSIVNSKLDTLQERRDNKTDDHPILRTVWALQDVGKVTRGTSGEVALRSKKIISLGRVAVMNRVRPNRSTRVQPVSRNNRNVRPKRR